MTRSFVMTILSVGEDILFGVLPGNTVSRRVTEKMDETYEPKGIGNWSYIVTLFSASWKTVCRLYHLGRLFFSSAERECKRTALSPSQRSLVADEDD